MQATARRLSVVSSTSCARRRLIRDVRRRYPCPVKHYAEQIVSIDLELRFILFGLQMVLDIPFSVHEMDRVFTDSIADQVSAKEYLIYESSSVAVTGHVDDYEPETIRLRLRHRDAVSLLPRIVEAAHYEIVRINRANENIRNA
jgi:hypothetical protein